MKQPANHRCNSGAIDRIKAGDIKIHPRIAAMTAEDVRFTDGQIRPFDVISLAIRYEAWLGRLYPDTTIELDRNALPVEMIGTE